MKIGQIINTIIVFLVAVFIFIVLKLVVGNFILPVIIPYAESLIVQALAIAVIIGAFISVYRMQKKTRQIKIKHDLE